MSKPLLAPTCPDRLSVYRYAAGETSGIDRASIEEHLRACLSCRRLMQELESADQKLGELLPAEELWSKVPQELPPARSDRRRLVARLAMAAGIGLAVVSQLITRPSSDDLRAKGGVDVELAVERNGAILRKVPSTFCAGDRVQLTVRSPISGHVELFELDDHGAAQRILPQEGEGIRVSALAETRLPYSLLIDGKAPIERWRVLVSDGAIAKASELSLDISCK